MIYNDPNNTANLHKHIHYWRLNCGAAVTVLGYGEDRERILILAPDSRFPLSSYILQPFSWLLINDDPYKPIKLHKHTYEWKPSCKAAVTIYKQKEVRCTILGPIFSLCNSGPQIIYLTIVLQTLLWVMIYDNPNNLNNLHKLNHDQQPNCRAVLTFWVTERIENKYYSRPQILDFKIPLLPCSHSHGYWSHW